MNIAVARWGRLDNNHPRFTAKQSCARSSMAQARAKARKQPRPVFMPPKNSVHSGTAGTRSNVESSANTRKSCPRSTSQCSTMLRALKPMSARTASGESCRRLTQCALGGRHRQSGLQCVIINVEFWLQPLTRGAEAVEKLVFGVHAKMTRNRPSQTSQNRRSWPREGSMDPDRVMKNRIFLHPR